MCKGFVCRCEPIYFCAFFYVLCSLVCCTLWTLPGTFQATFSSKYMKNWLSELGEREIFFSPPFQGPDQQSSPGSSPRSLQLAWKLLQVRNTKIWMSNCKKLTVMYNLITKCYMNSLSSVHGRHRCHFDRQSGLDQPDKKTCHEMAEGEVAGP